MYTLTFYVCFCKINFFLLFFCLLTVLSIIILFFFVFVVFLLCISVIFRLLEISSCLFFVICFSLVYLFSLFLSLLSLILIFLSELFSYRHISFYLRILFQPYQDLCLNLSTRTRLILALPRKITRHKTIPRRSRLCSYVELLSRQLHGSSTGLEYLAHSLSHLSAPYGAFAH